MTESCVDPEMGEARVRGAPTAVRFSRQGRQTKVRPVVSNTVPPVLWHLHSKTGSAQVHGFLYGESLPGMESVGPNPPVPLQPNLTYHVEVKSGGDRGGIDFVPRPAITE